MTVVAFLQPVRVCTKCHEKKPLLAFYKHKQTPDGIDKWCKTCKRAASARYRVANPNVYQEYQKRYVMSPERALRARQLKADRRNRVRDMIRQRYGTECACCGEDTPEFLTLDHINGNGNEERKRVGQGGVGFYQWLIRQGLPDGYRTLCFNCNSARGAFGACPHELREVKVNER